MSAEWKVVGQVSRVKKNGDFYAVTIADNRYYNNKKTDTLWFHCLSPREVSVQVGDQVVATGTFQRSYNAGFQFAMMIDCIGVIKRSDNEAEILNEPYPKVGE